MRPKKPPIDLPPPTPYRTNPKVWGSRWRNYAIALRVYIACVIGGAIVSAYATAFYFAARVGRATADADMAQGRYQWCDAERTKKVEEVRELQDALRTFSHGGSLVIGPGSSLMGDSFTSNGGTCFFSPTTLDHVNVVSSPDGGTSIRCAR